jgi:hypothetical protein
MHIYIYIYIHAYIHQGARAGRTLYSNTRARNQRVERGAHQRLLRRHASLTASLGACVSYVLKQALTLRRVGRHY